MSELTVLQLSDNGHNFLAILPVGNEIFHPGYLAQITHLLFGNHEDSERLLCKDVKPGTILADMGATSYIHVCFFDVPTGGFLKWVEALNKYTPTGWTAVTNGACARCELASPQSGVVYSSVVTIIKHQK